MRPLCCPAPAQAGPCQHSSAVAWLVPPLRPPEPTLPPSGSCRAHLRASAPTRLGTAALPHLHPGRPYVALHLHTTPPDTCWQSPTRGHPRAGGGGNSQSCWGQEGPPGRGPTPGAVSELVGQVPGPAWVGSSQSPGAEDRARSLWAARGHDLWPHTQVLPGRPVYPVGLAWPPHESAPGQPCPGNPGIPGCWPLTSHSGIWRGGFHQAPSAPALQSLLQATSSRSPAPGGEQGDTGQPAARPRVHRNETFHGKPEKHPC